MVTPAVKREAVAHLKAHLGLSERRACEIAGADRKMVRYQSQRATDTALRFRVLNVVDDVTRECLVAIPDTSISGRRVARELTALIERRGRPGMIVSDNVLAREQNAVLGVRSRGIRATGYVLNSCPGGLRRQEVVSAIANTGSAWLPPSPSLRRDPKSQAEGPNIIYEVRKLPPRLYREGSFRLGSFPRRRDDRVRRI